MWLILIIHFRLSVAVDSETGDMRALTIHTYIMVNQQCCKVGHAILCCVWSSRERNDVHVIVSTGDLLLVTYKLQPSYKTSRM
jgi:hypothetical protein